MAPPPTLGLFAALVLVLLGGTVLLPWNTLLVSWAYFGARLANCSALQVHFSSLLSGLYSASNLIFVWSCALPGAIPLHIRTLASLVLIVLLSFSLLLSTFPSAVPPLAFFCFLLLATCAFSLGAALLQNAAQALASRLGPSYLQAFLVGQAAMAIVLSSIQLVTSINHPSLRPHSLTHSSAPAPPHNLHALQPILDSSFSFYLFTTAVSLFTLLCYLLLLHLHPYPSSMPIPHTALSHHLAPPERRSLLSHPPPSLALPPVKVMNLWWVEKKIRSLGWTVFFVYLVTLSVFPAISASIISSSSSSSSTSAFFGNLYSHPLVFLHLHFLLFNIGDGLGRLLPHFRAPLPISFLLPHPRWSSHPRALFTLSVARTLFVPLFLMCNVQNSHVVLVNNDLAYWSILLAFAVSNGYIATLAMMAAIRANGLEHDQVELAGTCMLLYLTAGLTAGSLLSFGLKALALRL